MLYNTPTASSPYASGCYEVQTKYSSDSQAAHTASRTVCSCPCGTGIFYIKHSLRFVNYWLLLQKQRRLEERYIALRLIKIRLLRLLFLYPIFHRFLVTLLLLRRWVLRFLRLRILVFGILRRFVFGTGLILRFLFFRGSAHRYLK